MIESVSTQAYIFLCSVAGGMAIALIYDMFRISRKAIRTVNLLIYFEDLLYWLIVAVVMFTMVYYSNEGELRSYIFIGVIIGAILYMLLFSRIIISSSMMIINVVRKIFKTIFLVLIFPFKILLKILAIPARFTVKYAGVSVRGLRHIGRNRFSKAVFWKRAFKNIKKKI
jgi:spore cortex biosynthesis protein YabQ